jgi:hypothetical protein
MIGQQAPAADEAFPFINRTYIRSETPRKPNSASLFSLPASRELSLNRQYPPKMGRCQSQCCHGAGFPGSVSVLPLMTGSASVGEQVERPSHGPPSPTVSCPSSRRCQGVLSNGRSADFSRLRPPEHPEAPSVEVPPPDFESGKPDESGAPAVGQHARQSAPFSV